MLRTQKMASALGNRGQREVIFKILTLAHRPMNINDLHRHHESRLIVEWLTA
jgi:hypothetical protein